MKKILYATLTVIVLVIIFIVYENRFSNQNVRIGLIAPLTGLTVGNDNLGQGFLNGALLAKEEFEAKNPSAPKMDLVSEDDGYDSKKGLSAYQKEVSIDKIDALINLSSPTIDVIKSDVQKKGIPVLQLGAESEIDKDNIVQIFPDQTAVGMLGDSANALGVKTVTVVMQQIKAYEKFLSDFENRFSGKVSIVRVPMTERDFNPIALKIKELNSQGLVMFVDGKTGGQILTRMDQLGYHAAHLYFDLNLQFSFTDYQTTLGSSMNRILNGSTAMYSASEVSADFTSKYKQRFNSDPSELAGYGYDAYLVMAKTYSPDKNTWIANIENFKGGGATGPISFDNDGMGLRAPQWKMATFENGDFKI